jgi:rfaE bifunctional protein kinase chain/domain
MIEDIRILVVGDVMLDKYVCGKVERISPEAPVPIVKVTNEYSVLGGCGNVVRNIAELGAKVDCLASIGPDEDGQIISRKLFDVGADPLLFMGSKRTIVKERIISDYRDVQMLRIDREEIEPVISRLAIDIFFRMNCSKRNYDIVIISDYAKGMITEGLISFLKNELKCKIIVDPKPINRRLYDNVFMITPNENEYNEMALYSDPTLNSIEYILRTRGKHGMILEGEGQVWDIAADPVDVYNVSGAGDTVVAIMGVCLSMGFSPLESAKIANKCANYVVTQPGTSVVPKNKYMKIVEQYTSGGL